MVKIWQQNEEKGEEDELVVTEQRDAAVPLDAEESTSVETSSGNPRNALDVQGEDIGSSPSRRGHANPSPGDTPR